MSVCFCTVFPIGDFSAELPQDFDSYDDALEYGKAEFGVLGRDFLIEFSL